MIGLCHGPKWCDECHCIVVDRATVFVAPPRREHHLGKVPPGDMACGDGEDLAHQRNPALCEGHHIAVIVQHIMWVA